MKAKPSLTDCPVCSHELQVKVYHCPHCDTTIEGNFSQPGNPFSALSDEQLDFLMAFLRNEGKFNRLEEQLSLSYPTLRNRFDEVLRTLGFEAKGDPPAEVSAIDRLGVLTALADGKITAVEAQRKLAGK